MRFDVITLFPRLFDSFLTESLMGKALAKGAFEVRIVDLRDFTSDRHHTADDRPFGGGPGMVLKVEPVYRAIQACRESFQSAISRRIALLAPTGRRLDQAKVHELAGLDHLVLVCGRYEGVDQRVSSFIDEEISIGDYVLSGGEVPAMIVIEATARLLPGMLGDEESILEETFSTGLLEYPHYTRPREFQGQTVPEILLSGDHAAIRAWRLRESLRRTLTYRPDLLDQMALTPEMNKILMELSEKK